MRLLFCDQLRLPNPAACFHGFAGVLERPLRGRGMALLADDLRDHGAADAVGLGDLVQAHAAVAVSEHGGAIDIERMPADLAAFKPGPAHAGPDPFDDQVPLQLGDGADDHDDGAAERPAGVDVLAERDELDVEMVELIEDFDQVLHRPGQAVERPDQDNIEAAAAGVAEHLIEARAPSLGAADPVDVLLDDLQAALSGQGSEVVELGLGMLIDGRDPHVQSRSFHPRRPFFGDVLFETYCWINSISTSVMFRPLAAVAALKALCSSSGTFRFILFTF